MMKIILYGGVGNNKSEMHITDVCEDLVFFYFRNPEGFDYEGKPQYQFDRKELIKALQIISNEKA